MRHGPRSFLTLIAAALATATPAGATSAPADEGATPAQDLTVVVTGLRNARGQVMACLVADAAAFPDCRRHPAARRLVVGAMQGSVTLDFGAVPTGTYAISLFHDENGNGKLDTVVLIPREGFGFSRDAKVRMGPPRFAAAAFAVGNGPTRQTLRMRYMF